MRRAPSSAAAARVTPSTPDLMPEYTMELGADLSAAVDATLTMAPPRSGSMTSAAAWMPQMTALKPMSSMRSSVSGWISSTLW